ncbi:MAG: response regulator [Ignavibacteriaceae bacterium]|nr:response regulator [Ignavibacteriaceae bacterium]
MKNQLNIELERLENLITGLFEPDAFEKVSGSLLADVADASGADFALLCTKTSQGEFLTAHYDPENLLNHTPHLHQELERCYDTVIHATSSGGEKVIVNSSVHPDYGYLHAVLGAESLTFIPAIFGSISYGYMLIGKSAAEFSPENLTGVEGHRSLAGIFLRSLQGVQHNRYIENRLAQKQKLETIGKIAGGIAHDISNILSSIFGSVAILKRKAKEQEDILRLVTTIERGAVRAKDLTKNLLSYGKSGGKLKEIVHPEFLIEEISRMISDSFPATVDLRISVEEKPDLIHGNSTQLFQVLLNLCINAREAMADQGILELEVKNLTVNGTNAFRYPFLTEGRYIHFSIADTGKGINEQDLSKIFDPFFSTKGEEENSGLGLYIVYGIIKGHNGHIEVRSKINHGTRFNIYIPSIIKSAKHSVPSVPIILIADDEEDLCDLLGELLESLDYYVLKVKSGEEVLRIMKDEIKVDLLIIDFNMPGLNGIDTISQVRQINYSVPIIFSTGSTGFSYKIPVENLNISSIIHKPYDFETMLATIKELL